MIIIKQSTSRTLLIGPFIDDTDGKTAETGLTIAQADVRLSKNGGNMAQKTEVTSCTHDELGYYTCSLDTTDTNTLGILSLMVSESGALPVAHDYMIVTSNVWDTLCSTDTFNADVTAISGDPSAANNLELDYDGTGYTKTNSTVGTVTTNTDMRGTDSAALATALATVDTNVDTILVDTNELQTNQGDWATAVGFSVPNEYDTVIAALQTDLDNPNQYKSDVSSLALEATLTDIKGATFLTGTDSLEAIRDRGDVDWVTGAGGSSPTVVEIRQEMDSNSVDLNAIVTATAGLAGAAMRGTDGANSTTPPTVTEIRTEMDNNSIKMAPSQVLNDYKATGFSTHSASDIWSSVTRSLTDKAGFSLSTAGIKAIWDQLTSVLTTVGSLGKLLVDNINTTISSRSPANEYDTEMARLDVAISTRNAIVPNTVIPDAAGTAAGLHTTTDGLVTTVDGVVDSILVDTNELQTNQGDWLTATSVTVSDKTGFSLSDVGVDAILDEVIEGNHSFREMMKLFASVLLGKSSGGGTVTLTFRDIDDTKNRVVATVTDVGNRTAMTLTED